MTYELSGVSSEQRASTSRSAARNGCWCARTVCSALLRCSVAALRCKRPALLRCSVVNLLVLSYPSSGKAGPALTRPELPLFYSARAPSLLLGKVDPARTRPELPPFYWGKRTKRIRRVHVDIFSFWLGWLVQVATHAPSLNTLRTMPGSVPGTSLWLG